MQIFFVDLSLFVLLLKFIYRYFFASGVGCPLYPLFFLHYYTMILQHIRLIVGDTGFEPGTWLHGHCVVIVAFMIVRNCLDTALTMRTRAVNFVCFHWLIRSQSGKIEYCGNLWLFKDQKLISLEWCFCPRLRRVSS